MKGSRFGRFRRLWKLFLGLQCLATPTSAALNSDPRRYLHASGKTLKDAAGRSVRLRGVNIGGWLVTENWMCGIADVTANSDRFARETLEARFSLTKANALVRTWENHWFTEVDLDAIQAMHLNAIRVPFGYRNLQHADGSWVRDARGNIDFSRFDWIVREAGARGLYVILDLHIWAGQRADYSLVSRDSTAALPTRQQTAKLWGALAKRYAGNSVIAGFDLANEATGSPDNILQRTLYAAIRAEDPRRLLILESVWPADRRMSNVMYSVHDYNVMDNDSSCMQANYARELPNLKTIIGWNVPLYIGEFMVNGDANWAWLLQQYNGLGASWSPWTYKTANMSGWGIVNLNKELHVDINRDSYNTILNTWQRINTLSSNTYTNHIDVLQAGII